MSPGWDEIDLNFASWTVRDVGGGPATVVMGISGTWSGVGGNLGVSSLDGTDWVARTSNANNNTPVESFVNFDTIDDYYGLDVYQRGPGSAGSYAWFTSGNEGGWYTVLGGTYLGPVDGTFGTIYGAFQETTLLAKMYVTSGGDVAFEGAFQTWDGRRSMPVPCPSPSVEFSTAVPEPSPAVLLAIALIGFATGVWRRRG